MTNRRTVIAIAAVHSRSVIASEARQSMSPHVRRWIATACGLAMTNRNPVMSTTAPPCPVTRQFSNCRGMTLIEVLVAFVVLSLSLAVIMQIFSGGMRNARLAGSYSQAVFLARSRLAAGGLEEPIALGEGGGQSGPDLHWRVTVAPYDDGGAADGLLLPSRLYQVRVRVNWGEEGRDRQVELASLRLGPRR